MYARTSGRFLDDSHSVNPDARACGLGCGGGGKTSPELRYQTPEEDGRASLSLTPSGSRHLENAPQTSTATWTDLPHITRGTRHDRRLCAADALASQSFPYVEPILNFEQAAFQAHGSYSFPAESARASFCEARRDTRGSDDWFGSADCLGKVLRRSTFKVRSK